MTLSLFWRLALGYAAILLLSVGTSIYAIVQLGDLSKTARSAFEGDYQTLAQQEALTDAFLSEVRYGGKFLLTQSLSTREQYRQFMKDTQRYIDNLKAHVIDNEGVTQLTRIQQLHQSHHLLIDQEVGYLTARQPYAQSRYQQERTRILDSMMRELSGLKDHLESTLHTKLGLLGHTAQKTRNIAIIITSLLLIVGVALSLKISQSITGPLVALTNRFKSNDLNEIGAKSLSNIPEIQSLENALTQQKHRLLLHAEINSTEMEKLTDKIADRIGALKRNLGELKVSRDSTTPVQVCIAVEALSSELDNLIRQCAELSVAASARAEVYKLSPPPNQAAIETALPDRNPKLWPMRDLPVGSATVKFSGNNPTSRWANFFPGVGMEDASHKNDADKK